MPGPPTSCAHRQSEWSHCRPLCIHYILGSDFKAKTILIFFFEFAFCYESPL
jgi:hypothetical protein